MGINTIHVLGGFGVEKDSLSRNLIIFPDWSYSYIPFAAPGVSDIHKKEWYPCMRFGAPRLLPPAFETYMIRKLFICAIWSGWSTSWSVWDICNNEYDIHLSSLQFLVDFLQLSSLPPKFAQILSASSNSTFNQIKPNETTEKLTKINTFNRKGNVRLRKALRELLLPYKNQGKAMQNQQNLHKTKENHSKTTIFTEMSRKPQ